MIKTTAKIVLDEFDSENIKLDPEHIELINMLSDPLTMSFNYPEKSILQYGKICDHDDGYLCEHRLKYIINYLIKCKKENNQ